MNGITLRALALATGLTLAAHPSTTIAQEMRTITDDTGTEVTIPVKPMRIVSLHDSLITIPMLELGVLPVGSHGRGKSEDTAYIRTAKAITGLDFDNTNIEWVGGHPADIERVAALEPDLILTTQWQKLEVEKLRQVAPTVVLHFDTRTDYDVYRKIAEITGTTDQLAKYERRYKNQIEQIKALIDTENVKVSTLHSHSKGLYVFNPAGNIGKVLIDAGFQRPEIMDTVKKGDRATWFDPETLAEFDGDFLINAYRWGRGETPADVRTNFEKAVPGWCEQLHACREDQMITLSMDEVTASSYYALGAVAYGILTAIAGRDYVPMPR